MPIAGCAKSGNTDEMPEAPETSRNLTRTCQVRCRELMLDKELGPRRKCAPHGVDRAYHPHSGVCRWSSCQAEHKARAPPNAAGDFADKFTNYSFPSNLCIDFCLLIRGKLLLLTLLLCYLGSDLFFPLENIVVFPVLVSD